MSTSLSSTSKVSNGKLTSKSTSQNKSRKRKIVRARRPRGEFDSDEELELEAGSDSDSHFSDDGSATNSESGGSDLEEGSSIRSGRNQVSSPPTPVAVTATYNEETDSRQEKGLISEPSAMGFNWSDSVQESLSSNRADIPVVDFAEFRIDKEIPIHEEAVPDSVDVPDEFHVTPVKSNSLPTRTRSSRPSARQVYQDRLSKDPSFVPVVGEFWGHDDRLMDKEFRSLSGWWRGRWQGRGRGGFGGGWDRGRGGGGGGSGAFNRFASSNVEQEGAKVDKTWSHDGYEELNKTERRRNADQHRRGWRQNKPQQRRSNPSTLASDSRPRTPLTPTARAQAQAIAQGRPWFAKKPERIWTKQFDGFLYVDPELKPASGNAQNVRVRLRPGPPLLISLSESVSQKSVSPKLSSKLYDPLEEAIVRLPGGTWKGMESQLTSSQAESTITYEELPLHTRTGRYSTFPQQKDVPNSIDLPHATGTNPPGVGLPVDQTPSLENFYATSFQPSASNGAPSTSFASPIFYNPAFDYSATLQQPIYYNEMGYPMEPVHHGPYYMHHPSSHNPYGRVPSQSHVLNSPDMVHYQPMVPEYMVYPDAQQLQFSLPKRSAKVEIRAPQDVERAILVNPNNPSFASPSSQQGEPQPNPTYYPTIDTNANSLPSATPEVSVEQPVPYGEVHYYNPYGYSYVNPYENYDDGRRVYY